ncbi:MAG: hypothetical protein AAGJ35_13100, partial [Myxococcota bacterium]
PQGQRCFNGQCVPDRCLGVLCREGQVCEAGQCFDQPCLTSNVLLCRHQRDCQRQGCIDDRCIGMKCDSGQRCERGFCTKDTQGPDAESSTSAESIPERKVGDQSVSVGDGVDSLTLPRLFSGCGCESTSESWLWWGGLLVFLELRRRREKSRCA